MKYIPVFGRDFESIRKSLNSRTHLIETFERDDGLKLYILAKVIFPRGEVYSTQFTEIGWKSFSELHRII